MITCLYKCCNWHIRMHSTCTYMCIHIYNILEDASFSQFFMNSLTNMKLNFFLNKNLMEDRFRKILYHEK